MSANVIHSNADSHLNRIPGVTLDDAGFIHTAYGSYHPVTGEGLAFDMPAALKIEILKAQLQDGEDSGPAELWDFDAFMLERFSDEKP